MKRTDDDLARAVVSYLARRRSQQDVPQTYIISERLRAAIETELEREDQAAEPVTMTPEVIDECLRDAPAIAKEVAEQLEGSTRLPGRMKP